MRSERVAFVSGGMGGLGEAISRRLHDAGLTVAVSHSEHNDHVIHWLDRERAAGRTFHAFGIDVASYDSCAECAQRVLSQLGTVDVLINNAGITRDASFLKLTKRAWDEVMHTNLDSVFNLTRQFLPGMVERRFGRVVNISSVNGSRGAFGQTNYAASKAGIHGFTMSLALEVARHGVTVNTVSPGYLATAMVEAVPQDIMENRILPQIPVGRLGRPEEVASLIAWLCSDDGAFATGANFAVNGGMHMH
ncbi:acetoacetyl-CoA reductase [Paraburkholderia sacchari]|uniref:acetoacetyl-CoA reductase n=1 Tax=Paraburkholderia sacchari TaxID=159450 RepID=UPI000543B9A7|nr:acetoacetyl-CoA reductase [Paraburkholderia sacchari]NLP64574.1 acetoacetyl-CoA reductase [Paraburkholderia sacchari]